MQSLAHAGDAATTVGVLSTGNGYIRLHIRHSHQPQKWCYCWVAQHSDCPSPHSCQLRQGPTGLWQWRKYTLHSWVCHLLSLHQLCRVSLHMKRQLGSEWEGQLFGSIPPFVAGSAVGLQSAWHHSTLLSMPGSWHLLAIAKGTL